MSKEQRIDEIKELQQRMAALSNAYEALVAEIDDLRRDTKVVYNDLGEDLAQAEAQEDNEAAFAMETARMELDTALDLMRDMSRSDFSWDVICALDSATKM